MGSSPEGAHRRFGPSRYTNKYACYNRVYIISNWPLEKQYWDIQKSDNESWRAFLRRIHKVIVYNSLGNATEYSSVKDYFERDKSIE